MTGAGIVVNVIACGALASDLIELDRERGWGLSIHPLPPLLHNHPERIAGQVEELLDRIEPPTLHTCPCILLAWSKDTRNPRVR